MSYRTVTLRADMRIRPPGAETARFVKAAERSIDGERARKERESQNVLDLRTERADADAYDAARRLVELWNDDENRQGREDEADYDRRDALHENHARTHNDTTLSVSSSVATAVARALAACVPRVREAKLRLMSAERSEILSRFVVFEGGDGSGTTTQLALIGRALDRAAVPHWTTSEPTDGPEGLLIRRILSGELERDPGTLARLFAADRNEHIYGSNGILERLERGEVVLCDRYVLSSLAYQGVDCGSELPARLNADFPLPELLLYFDLDPAQSLGRIGEREHLDIFEDLPFQEKVAVAYRRALDAYAESGMKIVRIDASRSVAQVSREVSKAIGSALGFSFADNVE